MSAGQKFRRLAARRKPVQIPGAINAYSALLAERAGFEALYLSGAGVANASFGLPDLGVTTLGDVLEDARRITAATDLPLLVDVDTGFGSARVNLQVRSASEPALFTDIIPQPDGSVLLRCEGTPFGVYRIESSATLDPDSWMVLGSRTANAEGRFEYADAVPLPSQRFYRARVVV